MLGFGKDKDAEAKKAAEEAKKVEDEKLVLEAKEKEVQEKADAEAARAKEHEEMRLKLAKLEGKEEGRVDVTPAPEPIAEPTFDIPDADTISKAFSDDTGESGDPVVLLQKTIDQSIKKGIHEFDKTRVSQIENIGLGALDSLSDRVSKQDMPYILNGLLTKEYNDVVNTIPVANRANPAIRKVAYDQVVGQNIVKVTEYEADKAARNEEKPPTGDAPGGSRDKAVTDEKLTASSLGKDANELLVTSNRSLSRIAAQFGMTEEAYLQYAKEHGFIE